MAIIRNLGTVKTTITFERKLLEKIDRVAAIDGTSRSEAACKLIRDGIDIHAVMEAVHLFSETLRVLDQRLITIEENTKVAKKADKFRNRFGIPAEEGEAP